jgi:hypothetical protein
VLIEFVDTGYKTSTQADNIRRGIVKDYMMPVVFGVGFMGDGKYKSRVNKEKTEAYKAWMRMLGRTYSSSYKEKFPTYKGVTTCDLWHNFQNFAAWFDLNYIEGFHLDKDIKIKGNKVYSPEACLFVSPKENQEDSHAKTYTMINPDNEVEEIYNLTEYCRNRSLDRNAMMLVAGGKRDNYKGWTKAP